MTSPVQLDPQIDTYSQGGRTYYRCRACGEDFFSFRQGGDASGWLGLRINRRYNDHVSERHPGSVVHLPGPNVEPAK
jgi:hypothetical protein